jgi:hypothetical protein
MHLHVRQIHNFQRPPFGLATASAAQGRAQESASVKAEFDAAWQHADTPLTVDDL